jgi:nucleoside-diphosphate kinase
MARTLALIKPRAYKQNLVGPILHTICSNGFYVLAIKSVRLSKTEAETFYAVHKGKPFFETLVDFMSSGPVVAVALEKDHAVSDLRKLLGATDPFEATEGTIRKAFGESKTKNAVHGSDSDENAEKEISFFFSSSELIR